MSQENVRARENLMIRLQPVPGQQMVKEGLTPLAPSASTQGLGFGYLGDMQLRLVFEQPQGGVAAVREEDLARLELTPGKAVALSVVNLRRDPAQISSLGGGVYVLRSELQERVPAYLLERTFWRAQLQKFPQGLLAALPRPGVLMFAPAGDLTAADALERQATRMLHGTSSVSLSACLYRFDATGWHLLKVLPPPPPATARTREEVEQELQEQAWEEDLEKAAAGQKILVYSVLLGLGLNGLATSEPHPAVMLAIVIVLTIYSLWGVLRLSSGLRKGTGATITFMVLSFFPLLNLASWIFLSMQATRRLRAAGWRVGLLGARP